MRRCLLFIGAGLLVFTTWVSAQSTGLTSLQSDFSYKVFTNELDGALSVLETGSGPGFSQLNHTYYFGGIGNLEKQPTIGAPAVPLWFGYFSNSLLPMPMSAFLALNNSGGVAGTNTTTPSGGTTVGVTSGTTTTNYTWYNTKTEVKQKATPFTTLNDQAQFLTRIAGINLGLYTNVNLNNNSTPGTNYTQVVSTYYNTAAGGTKPTTALSKTTTSVFEALNLNNTIDVQIPAFMKTGNLGNFGLLGVSYNGVNTSTNATVTGTVPKDPAAGYPGSYTNTTVNGITQHNNTTAVNLQYTAYLPAFVVKNKDDSFFAGINGTYNIHGQKYVSENITQIENYASAGASPTNGTRTDVAPEVTRSYKGALDFNVNANAGQSFYFDLGSEARLGLIPQVNVGFSMTQNGNPLTKQVSVTHVDVNGDGSFSSNGDTSTTTTTTYANTAGTPGTSLITTSKLSTSLSVPVAIKFQPKGWWIDFIIGADPVLTYAYNSATTATAYQSSTQTVNATVGGTSTTTTVNTTPLSNPSTTTNTSTWTGTLNHNFGVQVNINDNVKFDVDVAGAIAGGIWDFRDLTVQGIVALK